MTNQRRLKFRFSLFNVVVTVTLVAMLLAVCVLYSELAPLREELIRLRNETGNLTVEEPHQDSVHAIQLESGSSLIWKWKVYLPAGRDYQLGSYVGKFPSTWKNVPPEWKPPIKLEPTADPFLYRKLVSPTSYRRDTEQTVLVSVVRNINGELVLRQQIGGISTESRLHEDLEDLIGGSVLYGGPGVGPGSTSRSHLDSPLPLLQERWDETYDFQKGIDGEPEGLIVWIEPTQQASEQ